MNILILGSNSFIAKYFIKRSLNLDKFNIILSSSSKKKVFKKKLLFINLLDLKIPKQLKKIDIIIDFGWVGVFGSLRDSRSQLKNIKYTKNLIKLIKYIKPKLVISFGSQAEYGNLKLKRKESSICKPKTLYGKIKNIKLKMLSKFLKKENIRFVWFRIFSCFGPNEKYDWLIPYVIKKFIQNEEIIVTKGNQKMDYVYIDDVIDAIVIAIQNKKMDGIFNIGLGKSYKVKYIINKIKTIMKKKNKIIFGKKKYRKYEDIKIFADISKLKKFKWKPKISLDKGLEKTIHYYVSQNKNFNS